MTAPPSVDAYLGSLPDDQRRALQRLREAIRKAAPDATEEISYGMPAFKDGGRRLVYYRAFKEHCSFFPASLRVIEELHEDVAPYLSGRSTLRFTPSKPLPTALVKKVVKARLAENASRRKG